MARRRREGWRVKWKGVTMTLIEGEEAEVMAWVQRSPYWAPIQRALAEEDLEEAQRLFASAYVSWRAMRRD